MFEKAPDSLWSERPSLRAAVASLIFVVLITIGVFFISESMINGWIQASYSGGLFSGMWPDFNEVGEEGIRNFAFQMSEILAMIRWGVLGLCVLGVVYNLFRILVMWSIRYEITPTRFMYHHGILVRRHDEIELHRIRDYRVMRPIFSRGLGLGTIYLVTRDETYPTLKIGPFVDARGIQNIIRNGVENHKQAVGFREFESH